MRDRFIFSRYDRLIEMVSHLSLSQYLISRELNPRWGSLDLKGIVHD